MTNPLLTPFELPPFSKILPEHVVPAVTKALNDCRENVERVVAQGAPYTWENLCQPLAEVDDVLGRIFSPVSHLNSVKNSPELREAYEQTLPLLSEYSTWVGQHEGLYKAYRDLRDGDHYATLNTAQKKACLLYTSGIPGSTLSHHISALVSVGLVKQNRESRTLMCVSQYAMLAIGSAHV